MKVRALIDRILIFTALVTFPIIAVAQWEAETIATGGEKCVITVDAAGNPHISYIDNVDSDTLKYTHWDGTNWQTAVVEPVSVSGATSIALDGSGNPHITFSIAGAWGVLKHTWWDGSTWQQAGIDSGNGEYVGNWNAIAVDSEGYPHIAYNFRDYDGTLKYAYQNAAGWNISVADNGPTEIDYISIVLDGNNHPHISYYDAVARDLKYAHWDGSVWQVNTVDGVDSRVGKYSSIALNSLDYPSIAYFDGTNYGVKYAGWDGSAWQVETVDPGAGYGYYTSLALDANDHPRISSAEYMSDLRFAAWDGSAWQLKVLDAAVSCAWTAIAIDDSDATHIAYYDDSQLILKYAKYTPIPVDETPPAAPQSLIATPGEGEISLQWRMNAEADVAAYMIYGGTSADPTAVIDSTNTRNDTSRTIFNLPYDIEYFFRVTAVDTAGNESAWSNQDSATTIGSPGWNVFTIPPQNALNVALHSAITVTFDQDMDAATINASSMVVAGSYSGTIAGTYSTAGPVVTFTPALPFTVGEQISVTLTTAIQSSTGETVTRPYCWSFTTEVLGGNGIFADTVNYAVGGGPYAIAAADLDGNRSIDLAVGNSRYFNISVLLNNGTGVYNPAGNYQVMGDDVTDCVSAADLDGDGDIDLAGCNAGVEIFLNDGAGIYTTAGYYPIWSTMKTIAAADLDGDGDYDLAVGAWGRDSISVLLNNGAGSFGTDSRYRVGSGSISIAAADLDGDGDYDLAVANHSSDNISVLRNNGAGIFAAAVNYGAGDYPQSLTATDLDGDGDADLAVANTGSDNISVFMNSGTGAFASQVTYAVGGEPTSITSTDVDGDGDIDLVAGGLNISLLMNNGLGIFGPAQNFPVGSLLRDVVGGDFDGDGDIDLATASDASGNISLLMNTDTIAANIWHVSTTGSDGADGSQAAPWATIQYAINCARYGDTVLVHPGTYTENINFNGRNVTVGSLYLTTSDTAYIFQTVIDGSNNGSVVTFENGEDSTAVLSGLTITNGQAQFGGGIACWNYSSPTLANLTIEQNTSTEYGGGILCFNDCSPSILNVTILGNSAVFGGGIFSHNYSNPKLVNVIINNNTAAHSGGGIECRTYSNSSLVSVSITGNSAYSGGGIFCSDSSDLNLINVIVSGNSADIGGGLNIDSSNPTFVSGDVINNTAVNGAGFAIYNSSPILEELYVSGNNADDMGGGYYIDNSSPSFSDITLIGNSASTGGGFYLAGSNLISALVRVIQNTAQFGGAIATSGDCTISNMTITNNVSDNGLEGIYVENGYLNISNSNIAYNRVGLKNGDNINFVDAANNWWGHPSGPYHPTQNPAGAGDSTNTSVNVIPWRTSPDTTALPISPQNLTVTGVGDDFINLSWESSPFGDFAGFRLSLNNVGNDVDVIYEVVTSTSCSVTGLPVNTTYYVIVQVFDTAGNISHFSDAVEATTRVLEAHNLDIGGDDDLLHLTNHNPAVSFDYFDSMGQPQESFWIQVSSQSDFSSVDMWDIIEYNNQAASIAYGGAPLMDGNTYYLRVRFQVPSTTDWGLWSDIEFRLNTEPSIPSGIAPIENQVLSGPPTLSVDNSSDAEGDDIEYRFDLYDDASLTIKLDSALAVPAGAASTNWVVAAALPDNGQYWWTVSASDGHESSSINGPYSFLLNTENNVPGAFTLLLPAAGTTMTSPTPVFSWSPAQDPDPIDTVSYSLMILTSEPTIITMDTGTDTSLQVIDPLMDDTEYHWKVVARDQSGFETINNGGLHSFIINSENAPPSAVYLITPSDSSHEITLTPGFYWTESIDPDPGDIITYILKYWLDPIYVTSIPSDSNSVELTTPLIDNSFYSWSVVSNDDHGGSAESEASMFWTDTYPEPPSSFFALLPLDNAQVLSTQVEFVWQATTDPDPFDFATYNLVYATDWADSSTYTFMEGIADSSVSVSMNDNTGYSWLVEAVDKDGQITPSNEGQPFKLVVGALGNEDELAIPNKFALHQNYPNPFNPTTWLCYDLPEQAFVQLAIYDLLGRQVTTLVNRVEEPGYRSATWNGTDAMGKAVSAGMYLYVIKANDFVQTRKMILLK